MSAWTIQTGWSGELSTVGALRELTAEMADLPDDTPMKVGLGLDGQGQLKLQLTLQGVVRTPDDPA